MSKGWFSYSTPTSINADSYYSTPTSINVDSYYNKYDELNVGDSSSIVMEGFNLFPLGSELPFIYKEEIKYIVHINSVYLVNKTKNTTVTFTVVSKDQK